MSIDLRNPNSVDQGVAVEQLQHMLQGQKMLSRILGKLRNGIDLQTLCATTSQDVCRLLGIERIAVYRFHDDWSGHFLNSFGFAQAPWDNTINAFGEGVVWEDTHLQETQGGRYVKNEPFAVEDVYEAGHSRCHLEVLEQFQIRAYTITPIFVGNRLWGLLAAYQHSGPKTWAAYEVEFLVQVASHFGVAMQQADIRNEAKQKTADLQNSVARQRALTEVVGKIRSSLNTKFIFDTTCQELCDLLKLERAAIYQFKDDWSGEFISHFGLLNPDWESWNSFGKGQVWEDTHLQETQGGRYRNNESFAVDDIHQAGHSRCHIEILEQFRVRAYAIVPIFIGPRLWGLLAAYHHTGPRKWLSYEVEFLSQIGAQLGVAIQQADLLEQSKQQAIAFEQAISRQRALTEVVSKIRSSLNTDLILQNACQEVCKLLNVERVGVYRFNDDWSGEFISHFGSPEVNQWLSVNPFGKHLVWEDTHLQETKGGRYRNNESFAVNDVYQVGHTRCHLDILEQFKIRAYALTPIFVGRNLWGLLGAYHHSGPRDWAAIEVEFLSQVANQLGVAIQSADMLAETRTRAEELQQSSDQRQILFDVVAKIRESLDLETIFKTTVREIRRSLKADRVGVFQFEAEGERCRGLFIAEDVMPTFEPALYATMEDQHFGEHYASQYAQGRYQAVANIAKSGLQECYIEFLERFQIKAQIVVPLMEGERLWGLLCVHQCTSPRNWADAQIKFVTQVAAQLSVAIRQANLLGQTREQAEKLAQTLNDLQKAQLQMIQSEKMASLGQLVAGVAHEINNPINFIHGNLDYAERYTQDLLHGMQLYRHHHPEPSAEIQAFLQRTDIEFLANDMPKLFRSMQDGTNRIREIILSLRNFSRLDEAEVKEVDIHDGLNSTIMILQNRLKPTLSAIEIQIIRNFAPLPLIECYPGQLNQVFMNILSNAIDALEEFSQMRQIDDFRSRPAIIQISTSMIDDGRIAIYISDNGPGIPEELAEQIFNPFFTTKDAGKGTGLGLSISYQIVTEKHGGQIRCNPTAGEGTEFTIEIPIRQTKPFDRPSIPTTPATPEIKPTISIPTVTISS
ncbi:GAF domain-containing protein [filamentous cyanobacterium LEGE 11480]|uniref:histidine kinase n=2 Tax=Romeriopsis TaxID=2992131 RepID=A0A928VLV2_9CYAN|nr:GAF domain-containing protein [Romeriopsis navalis LEGE 11480]